MTPKKINLPSKFNLSIFVLSLLLSFLGFLAIYNSSAIEGFVDFGDKYHFVKNQLSWLFLSLVVFLIISKIKTTTLKQFATPIFIVSLVFMALVLIPGFGAKLQGARRWFSLGPVRFQPSELFKLSLIIYLSSWLEKPQKLKDFLLLILFCLGLVMAQPDLGTAVIIASSAFVLYYLSGAKIRDLGVFFGLLIVAVSVLILSSPYRLRRLQTFMDPTSDPLGASYHVNQILLGLGSGGLFGVGIGQSRQKYAYLPESSTDSIFVIVAEEFGFFGATILIILLGLLIMKAFRIANQASNQHQKLLASGISLLLLIQVFVNLGAMVALLPLTGVPLPFISYGGSSLVTIFAAMGILASIDSQKRTS